MATPVSEEELIWMSVCAIALCKKKKSSTNKKKWMKKWLLEREVSRASLLNEQKLKLEDWYNNLHIDETTYCHLLSLVTPLIEKHDTVMRKAITPHARLSATLCFLATGRSYEDLKFKVAISAQALGRIIPDTCRAIWETLQKDYMKLPNSEEEWTKLANEYYEKWNFPNCLGAVAGRHVLIIPPHISRAYYYNYKGSHSLVLLTAVSANGEFIMCDFGTNGCMSDGVMENSTFYEQLCSNSLKIPPDRNPEDSSIQLPYVFVGDEAFNLHKHVMTPFSQEKLTHEHRVFNYNLSRAHQVTENVFSVMSDRFRIFKKPINLGIEKIDIVVMACCVLHNYLFRLRGDLYASLDSDDFSVYNSTESAFMILEQSHNQHCSKEAKEARERFQQYFSGEGLEVCKEEVICQEEI